MNAELVELCAACGIVWRYLDGANQPNEAPEETCLALLKALGIEIDAAADVAHQLARIKAREAARPMPATVIVDVGTDFEIDGNFADHQSWQLQLDGGNILRGTGNRTSLNLPGLPLGIHSLTCQGHRLTVLSAPRALPLPRRGWGVMVPLYGLRSETEKGIGDFHDLERLAAAFGPLGADFVGINPVHTGFISDPAAVSPYSPSSRQRLNPLHICIDQLPHRGEIASQVLANDGGGAFVDYPAVIERKNRQLKSAFAGFTNAGGSAHFESFIRDEGSRLQDFAIHQALAQKFGPYWPGWPQNYQSPGSPATRRFARDNAGPVRYQCWLQWSATNQLKAAQQAALNSGMACGLYLDLAVGTDPAGAETWADRQTFATGVAIGSPSDSFNALGQNWGLVPFNPLQLAARQYTPLVDTLRAQLQFAGILRIDHILGFERSFWIPDGLPGAYVTFPRDRLLAIARIEAARAKAHIVGEDLGNVPDGLRDELVGSGIMGCRVAFFERDWAADKSFTGAADYTHQALASITTHDLPTLLGWWHGVDIDWRLRIGEISEADVEKQKAVRRADCMAFAQVLGLTPPPELAPGDPEFARNLCVAAHRFLAQTRSVLVAVQIEDLLGLRQQPNVPGTVTEHPNWRRRLPKTLNEIAQLPLLSEIKMCMEAANRIASNRATGKKDAKL